MQSYLSAESTFLRAFGNRCLLLLFLCVLSRLVPHWIDDRESFRARALDRRQSGNYRDTRSDSGLSFSDLAQARGRQSDGRSARSSEPESESS
jgi:hypothetical protein